MDFQELCSKHGTPIIVYEESKLIQNFKNVEKFFPEHKLMYNLSLNSHEEIVSTLKKTSITFAYSSPHELDLVKDVSSKINILPVKATKFIEQQVNQGSNLLFFDNKFELGKLVKWKTEISLCLKVNLSENQSKFGVKIDQIDSFLKEAKDDGFNVVGLNFEMNDFSKDWIKIINSSIERHQIQTLII